MYGYKNGYNHSNKPSYVYKSVWINYPPCYKAPENMPNGKSAQKFYFKKPWEPKHAIGKNHQKRLEFEAKQGINHIYWSAVQGDFGCFLIDGKPEAVDQVMKDIANWMIKCKDIYAKDILKF